MATNSGLRPLYLVDALAKGVGREVTYAYDDLVFIEHSEVLIQFTDEQQDTLHFFNHTDLDESIFADTKAKYEIVAKEQSTSLIYKGRFGLVPKADDDEIELQFFPAENRL